ncbi:2-dehydropantoate 2-reductase [Sphingosinicella sp. CPCC 101087]|uniref:2-dehydropantoate 2-reductase n=1 Tax=Sphingosinicella sp. CPCC 101087 TaxID=2497754 RepID=UPI00101D4E6B|nr:2-dehydropantoate 2-reductase [Sphingosinicella sp. CPCC 101087]
MRIAIMGAGSVGCYIGAAWAAAGLDVVLIGRRSVRDEIAANGLTATDSEGRRIEARPDEVEFSTNPRAMAKADLVALCVKSHATDEAAKEIRKHARRDAVLISFQNGIGNADRLKSALPAFTVLRGMVPFNVARLGNGRWHKGVTGMLWAEDHPATRGLAEASGHGPGALRLSNDMIGVAWGKLLINLNNAVNALSGRTLLEQLGERGYRRIVAASQVEALELLEAAGIRPAQIGPFPPKLLPHVIAAPDFLFRRVVLKTQKIDARARSSMADDFAAGRPTEIDWLNGEVVALARRLGRRAPVNERIVALVKQAEAGVERSWSSDELREHVLEGRALPGFGY